MPLKPGGELETVSVILTREQARRLRALTALRRTMWNRVSMADVAREIFEAGFATISAAPHSNPFASDGKPTGEGSHR